MTDIIIKPLTEVRHAVPFHIMVDDQWHYITHRVFIPFVPYLHPLLVKNGILLESGAQLSEWLKGRVYVAREAGSRKYVARDANSHKLYDLTKDDAALFKLFFC